jgi:hypothetical protein
VSIKLLKNSISQIKGQPSDLDFIRWPEEELKQIKIDFVQNLNNRPKSPINKTFLQRRAK